jgi:hypothetical protein
MAFDFKSVADDFFVNLNLQTTLALPNGRDNVLHFFEAVQKEFPDMTGFYQRETGEHVLEGDRESGCYQWLELQAHSLSAGYFNPPDLEEAYRLHKWLLDRSVYFLGVSGLDVECLDLLFGFNLDYVGNRDAIVSQALLGNSPLAALLSEPAAQSIEFEPSLVVALDPECYLQARLSLETRSNSFQVRTGEYEDEPISVYFTARRYPRPGRLIHLLESFTRQSRLCEDWATRIVIPSVIQPIAAAIAAAQ